MTEPRFNYTGYGSEGKNYNPDLGIKDIAKFVRVALRKQFPLCKFSVQLERYSLGQSLNVNLMQAPFDVFDNDAEKLAEKDSYGHIQKNPDDGYAQLNHYQFNKKDWGHWNNGCLLTEEAWRVMKGATEIADSFNFSDCDGQIDYFHVNYYLHISIGKWDKPFQKI